MSRPLVWVSVFFCAGIIFARFISLNFWVVFTFAVLILSVAITTVRRRTIFATTSLLLCSLIGALVFYNHQTLSKNHISNFVYYKSNNFYSVKGIVDSQPQDRDGSVSFVFKVQELHYPKASYDSCGKILVEAKNIRSPCFGQDLILKGYLRPVIGFQKYLKRQGIFCIMRVESQNALIPLRKEGLSVMAFAFWLKQKMQKKIFEYVPAVPASVLEAMILGEQKNVTRVIYDSMVKTGTVHILVVSGFNVGIVIFMVMLFLKILRIRRTMRFLIAIPCIILYCLLTGASNPVVRATVMGVFFLTAYLIKREPDIYISLSLAALFILSFSPDQLFNVGFQLSFASVFSIVYLYPRLKGFLRLESLKIKPVRSIAEGGVVSLSAWLGTCGFIAYYFKFFSPVTIVANLLIVPLATLITLCGFSLVFASVTLPFAAGYFASTSELAVTFLVKLNLFLSNLPGATFRLP